PTPPEEMAQRQEERAQDRARRSSADMRLEKARADKARAEKARAELARSEAARNEVRSDLARNEVRGEIQSKRGDDVSAAFSAMGMETASVPAPDPIAEFAASQYDVITPPDPIEPPSLSFGPPPGHIEAPTYLGERPQPRAKTPTPSAKVSPASIA